MATSQYLYEYDDELTHRLVYIGALAWPDDEHKGIRLVTSARLDELAEQYGLCRHKRENPEYKFLYYDPLRDSI